MLAPFVMLEWNSMSRRRKGSSINKITSALYKTGRVLRDVKAVSGGNPFRIISRFINKFLGKLFSRTWR